MRLQLVQAMKEDSSNLSGKLEGTKVTLQVQRQGARPLWQKLVESLMHLATMGKVAPLARRTLDDHLKIKEIRLPKISKSSKPQRIG